MLLNPSTFKTFRENSGHSQFSLAAAAGVAQSRISEIEKTADDAEPIPFSVRPATAKKLADAMGVPVTALRCLDQAKV